MLSLVAADSSHQESYLYQLLVEKEESVMVPTTQQLLQLSFYQSQIKLREVSRSVSVKRPCLLCGVGECKCVDLGSINVMPLACVSL